MKRNQNSGHNPPQKVLSCRYNMDTNRVEAQFEDGTTLSIDCIAIEEILEAIRLMDADERRELTRALFA